MAMKHVRAFNQKARRIEEHASAQQADIIRSSRGARRAAKT